MNKYAKPVEYLRKGADQLAEQAARAKVRKEQIEAEKMTKAAETYHDAADVLEDIGEETDTT